MTTADAELLARLDSGDGLAFEELMAKHLPALRAYVRLNVPPDVRARESCSDLVQSVCREVLEKRQEFDYCGPEAFRAWLCRWALCKIRDRGKYHRRERRAGAREQALTDAGQLAALYGSVGTPSAAAIAREHAELLEQAFDRLDDGDRQVIALCRIAGLPREQVAELLGKSTGAVRTHLSRALVRLAGVLEQLGVRAD